MIPSFCFIVYSIEDFKNKDSMGTLQLQDISLAFSDRDILSHISCTVDTNTRAALAGANGSGKSTLLKIITGSMDADSGTITATKGMQISYLPQGGIEFKDRSLYEELEGAFSRYHDILQRKERIGEQLASCSEDSRETQALLEEFQTLEEHILHSDYYHREARILQVATGLGFTQDDIHRPSLEFSGGWQMRIALGKILLEHPDILLLDEPTNYLDVEARLWLKSYLIGYSGGCILVSHDRYFLDATTTEVLELYGGGLKRYQGSFTTYERIKAEELIMLEKAYLQQQLEIRHIEEFIERFRYKASKAKQVQSRIKQLEKIERIVIPSNARHLSFTFPPPPHAGNDICRINGLTKAYGEHVVISDLQVGIDRGERLAVTGKNGMGKTTLLRILAGLDTDYSGEFVLGAGVRIGYFAQDTDSSLHHDRSVLEEIESEAPTSSIPLLRSLLGAFLFQGDDIYKQVSVLSGGEKSRLALLKILLEPVNVLILDEPTNHLDIASKDMLLRALESFKGTLIFVSHDIDFIKHLATSILYLSEDAAELFVGDYDYFSWKLDQKAAIEQKEQHPSPKVQQETIPKPVLDRQERNRIRNRIQALKKEEAQLLEEIDEYEQQVSRLHHDMSLPEVYSDGIRVQGVKDQIDRIELIIEERTEQWDLITAEAEQLKEQYDE